MNLQDVLNASTLGSIYLLFALGMALVWGTMGILNFAHGSVFMFSAFVGYLITSRIPLPLPAVVLIAMVVGAVLTLAIQYFAYQPILKKIKSVNAAELQIVVAGIGLSVIPIALAEKETLSNNFGFQGSTFQTVVYQFGDLRISNIMIIILVLGLGLGFGTAWWIAKSRQGLGLRAVGIDPEVAALMGVDRRKMALATMAFAGALAGLAGALLTYYLTALNPHSGEGLILKAFAAIILGGLGSVLGVILGSFILAFAETAVFAYTSGTWVSAVSFGLILILLVVRPQGILGKKEVRRT